MMLVGWILLRTWGGGAQGRVRQAREREAGKGGKGRTGGMMEGRQRALLGSSRPPIVTVRPNRGESPPGPSKEQGPPVWKAVRKRLSIIPPQHQVAQPNIPLHKCDGMCVARPQGPPALPILWEGCKREGISCFMSVCTNQPLSASPNYSTAKMQWHVPHLHTPSA